MMLRQLVDSHADWWALAGFEAPVGEQPCDWLAQTPAPIIARTPAVPEAKGGLALPAEAHSIAPVKAPQAAPMPLAPLAMPDDLTDFQQWLATADAIPGTMWHRQRVLPVGQAGAALMLLSLCPEMDDQDSGTLHSGAAGKLLDAMLRAIGLYRDECYLASLALTRPPGGRIDDAQASVLMPLLWHHLRLAKPERLLLFGGDLTRLVTGEEIAALRGQLRLVNQDGVKVEAVAIQHPMLLLDRPARKAAAWESLKLLARG